MRKYHNIIKSNILKNYKGNLLDIGIVKILKRIASDIKNGLKIIQNEIQNIDLNENFNINMLICFLSLNYFIYIAISDMLKNIGNNIW
ncbi:hypothetical protein PIROE2DRAFT_2249 [Piromyces sp. E2]|nr:hypothetical protein PIROE2DRAFT_2249 [Piromyces sp. E2]|eukprot:OUM69818.1 hypothetical protein PIROE2DRAFT_2249 [Piromyces sp. E2]